MRRSESGQTIVEYVLLLVLVVGATRIVLGFLPAELQRFERLMSRQYAASYRYGDPKTKGPDDEDGGGEYELHPRALNSTSFRLWKRSDNNVAVRR
jgi:hypothetical protein